MRLITLFSLEVQQTAKVFQPGQQGITYDRRYSYGSADSHGKRKRLIGCTPEPPQLSKLPIAPSGTEPYFAEKASLSNIPP